MDVHARQACMGPVSTVVSRLLYLGKQGPNREGEKSD